MLLLTGCGTAAVQKQAEPTKQTTAQKTAKQDAPASGRWAKVTKVTDGDTLELDGSEKVRLIGVNTPETVKKNTPVMPYGEEASHFTKSQLTGQKVYVEVDVQPQDRYGRTLAYVFTEQPKSEQEVESYMFNATLVREGYAQLMTIPPNVKYQDLFVKLQRQAREQNKGLWALGIYKDSAKSTNDVFLKGKEPKK